MKCYIFSLSVNLTFNEAIGPVYKMEERNNKIIFVLDFKQAKAKSNGQGYWTFSFVAVTSFDSKFTQVI